MEQYGEQLKSLQDLQKDWEKKGIYRTPKLLEEYQQFNLTVKEFYLIEDFYNLSSTRQNGESSVGGILYSEIMSYLVLGVSNYTFNEGLTFYCDVIKHLDRIYRNYRMEQIKKEFDKSKAKTKSRK